MDKNVYIPHPTKHRISENPGLAIAKGTFDGFGRHLCVSIENTELTEEFGEDVDKKDEDN